MSFQKINQADKEKPQGRECILSYGFMGKDFVKLQNFCTMIGIKDVIQIHNDMLEEKVQNIIDDNISKESCKEAPKERALVFNAFSGQKLHIFLENFKRTGFVRPLIATTTANSLTWTFHRLVLELQKEREAIAKMNQVTHENSKRS